MNLIENAFFKSSESSQAILTSVILQEERYAETKKQIKKKVINK